MQPSLLRTLLLATTLAATPSFLWASDALEGSQDETTVPSTPVPSIADLSLEPSASIPAPVLDTLDTVQNNASQDAAVSDTVFPDSDDEAENIDPAVIADNDGVEVNSDALADTDSESGEADDFNPATNATATGEAIADLEGFDDIEDAEVAPIENAGGGADAGPQHDAARDDQGTDSEGFSSEEEGTPAENDANPDNS